ncbi:MAG: mannose-1-phosphate guanyltransferase [Pleopsidium flavum]|nr:MAG: mannose-1-phosphate guanyltransferase [Pleopsidium flavum]
MERQHLPTGFSQLGRIVPEQRGIPAPDDVATSFFSTSGPSFGSVEASIDDEARSSSSDKTDEEILSQFYEHSFAVHENIASSQIDVQEVSSQEGADLSVAITSTSCLTSTSSSYSFGSPASPVVDKNSIPISGRLSDLADIPNASYLHSISPQTMTVDLIVGIISIPAPRFIKTRRGGREMELVEMLVGDETKAGFAINFWLPPLHDAKGRPRAESNLKKELESSRPGDIVSTINVALSSFRGKVYGQSLRKDMTKLGLLYRSMDNLEDTANHNETIHSMDAHKKHPQVAKAKRVKEWVMQFVGSSNQADAVKIDAQSLILVGGFGTRLRPLTLTLPKPLVEFANRPMILHQVESLAAAGVTDIVLAVNYRPDVMVSALKKYEEEYNVKIEFSVESEPLGTAGPLKLAEKILGKDDSPFFVLNSDVICDYPFQQLADFHKSHGEEGTIVVTKVEEPSKYGVIVHKPSHPSRIDRFVEKPVEFVGNRINAGIYILNPSVLKRIELRPTSIEQETFPAICKDGQLHSFDLEGFWMDVGQPKDFLSGTCLYLSSLTKKGSKKLTPSSVPYVHGGNVLVDPTAKVGRNCRIGPNVTIGPNVIVGDGVRLQRCVLLAGSKVKDHAWVKSTIVGWNSSIGKWARLENVSVLGDDVTIGDEIYVNGGSILPHKSIKQNVDVPAIIM